MKALSEFKMPRVAALGMLVALICCAGMAPNQIAAQIATGTITGQISDGSGSMVAGAGITLTRKDTGLVLRTTSNTSGIYTFTLLQPATYILTAEKPGFKKTSLTVTLAVAQTAGVNIVLNVGSVSQTVTVSGDDAGQLETQNSGLDFLVNDKVLDALPLNGRNPYALAELSPGVLPMGSFGTGLSTTRGAEVTVGNNNFQTNGGIAAYNEILLDGISIVVCCQGQPAVTVSLETVDQFKVLTSVPPAQYGGSSGGVMNLVTKSGSNQIHGDVYDYFRNRVLDAANYFTKLSGIPPIPGSSDFRAPHQYNQYGGTFSGPVVLPKIYNGKDSTFFFFGYEGVQGLQASYLTTTVPTALERQGIFTEAPDPIYNPNSSTSSSTNRTPIAAATCNGTAYAAGYCIPPSTWSPVATALMALYPAPNAPGVVNNYDTGQTEMDTESQYNGRIDHNFSSTNRAFGRVTYDTNSDNLADLFNHLTGANSEDQVLSAWIVTLGDTWEKSANTAFRFTYGFALQKNTKFPGNYFNYDPTSYGFSSTFASQQSVKGLPEIGVSSLATVGTDSDILWDHYIHTLGASAILQRGRHMLTIGGDAGMDLEMEEKLDNPVGDFSFTDTFNNGPKPNGAVPTGQGQFDAFAAFLEGYPSSGSIDTEETDAFNLIDWDIYAQDDWKVAQKLTLNLGVRYDPQTGFEERYNRWADFNPNATNPLAASTGLPFTGGAQFLGGGNPSRTWKATLGNLAPRVGLAYAVFPSTVLRGGYGIFYLPTQSRIYDAGTFGFEEDTSMVATINGFTPVDNIANPFPSGIQVLQGSSAGVESNAGTSVSPIVYNNPEAYQQQWNVGIQQGLKYNMVFSLNYAGSHGVKLPIEATPDDLNPKYFGAVGDQTQVAYLQDSVANPFYGLVNTGTLSDATIERYLLLDAYPQYTGLTERELDSGSATYNAMQVLLSKQANRNLIMSFTYMWSKLMGNVGDIFNGQFDEIGVPGYQNYYLMHQYEHAVLSSDVRNRVAGSAVYALPFRKGGNRWLNGTIGGWQLNTILSLQSGFPMYIGETGEEKFSGVRPNFVPGVDPLTQGNVHSRLGYNGGQRYLNPNAFALTQSFQMGDIPRFNANIRLPATFQDDASAIKNFSIREDLGLEFRVEAFNVMNKVQFGEPGDSFGSSTFGVISDQENLPRNVQLALKLHW